MIEELKKLEVDWSTRTTIKMLSDALAMVKKGEGGDELYEAMRDKLKEAEDYFNRPLDSIDFYRELAEVAKKQGDKDTEDHARAQLALYEANDLQFLGYRESFFGNNTKATEYLEKALELVPDHELALKDMDKAQKRVDRSTRDMDKLKKKAEETGTQKDIDNLGKAHHDLGQMDEAMACYQKLLDQDPNDPVGLGRMGCALASQERFAEALPYFEKALDINPKNLVAKRGLNYVSYILGQDT